MTESPLMIKSKEFALTVIKVCKELRNAKCESALINQFLRLGTSITDFKKAGLKPMFYGITIDTLVILTALVVIWCMGLM